MYIRLIDDLFIVVCVFFPSLFNIAYVARYSY